MATLQEKLEFLQKTSYYIVQYTSSFYKSSDHPENDQVIELDKFDMNELNDNDTFITFHWNGDEQISRDITAIEDFKKAVDYFYEYEKEMAFEDVD